MPEILVEEPKRPSICVVIPMWNKKEETAEFAMRARHSVFAQTDSRLVDVRLVLVDNASPFQTKYPTSLPYDVVLLTKNRGFGPAVNLGLSLHPDTDYVCQMNSDCELVEDSINKMIRVLEANQIDVTFPEHYENCKHYGLDKGPNEYDLMGQDWRFGAFWVARRSIWDAVGGFDPIFEMCYWEDTDLWKRMELIGGKLAGCRWTWVMHKGGASSLPDRDAFFAENKRRFDERWNKGKVC